MTTTGRQPPKRSAWLKKVISGVYFDWEYQEWVSAKPRLHFDETDGIIVRLSGHPGFDLESAYDYTGATSVALLACAAAESLADPEGMDRLPCLELACQDYVGFAFAQTYASEEDEDALIWAAIKILDGLPLLDHSVRTLCERYVIERMHGRFGTSPEGLSSETEYLAREIALSSRLSGH